MVSHLAVGLRWLNVSTTHRGNRWFLEIERNGAPLSLTLIPDTKPVGKDKAVGFAGIIPKVIPLPDEYKTIRQYGPFSALYQAGDKTWQLMHLTVSMIGKLITGDVKLNNLSGPDFPLHREQGHQQRWVLCII
ncbi:Regulator of sigma E protease [Serratia fonticola]|uniref:Regulator of sigma E protease n=1 Tax=Serratia fonticola TaxID=47917 RepID=A0A4U9WPS1_SERFO|nr:Regulator of sigma E protease [Serratia fonticola]